MKKPENSILLDCISKKDITRPPIWLMRQAGRILKEYREIRASVDGFKALVKNPELSAEVTVQPLDILNVDACIFFSDILVIPECMGLDYELIEKKGPWFPKVIEGPSDIDKLIYGKEASDKLDYVYNGLSKTLDRIDGRVPLIGFSGAPWTLFCYMIEGQGSKTFSKAKRFIYKYPEASGRLLDFLTDTIITYLQSKIDQGVHVVQVFDSWAGVLDKTLYNSFMVPRLRRINDSINRVPVILFSKGAWFSLDSLAKIGPEVIGIDWTISPEYARTIIGKDQVVQGNLDPCVLYGSKELIEAKTHKMIRDWGANHVVNLGHGVYPDTPVEHVKSFINSVKNFSYSD